MKYSALAETIRGITLVQEQDGLPTIYCDMDGVLCDFNQGIANMLNYFMPPEVVDMVRYKLKIVPKRGKIKF